MRFAICCILTNVLFALRMGTSYSGRSRPERYPEPIERSTWPFRPLHRWCDNHRTDRRHGPPHRPQHALRLVIQGQPDQLHETHDRFDVLDIERVAHGKLTLNLEPADLCVLLEETAKLFSPVAINKSCSVLTDLSPKPLWVSVDYDRLLQVVANLVGNVMKFTPSGGIIPLNAMHDHMRVTVSVTDTGIGIAEQDRPKVFRKFSQLDHAESGLGLGLYLAKSIVEAHGGTMWVDSTVGQGSAFRFTCLWHQGEAAGVMMEMTWENLTKLFTWASTLKRLLPKGK